MVKNEPGTGELGTERTRYNLKLGSQVSIYQADDI